MAALTLPDKHGALVSRLLLIEDPQERLAAILQRSSKIPPLPAEYRTESHRVEGCVSGVWLRAFLADGLCSFELHAESQLVRALAALVCEPCQLSSPSEVAVYSGDILGELQIVLTPTRAEGLGRLLAQIRALAAGYVA
jgi:cysteine desulfuration protein SufE